MTAMVTLYRNNHCEVNDIIIRKSYGLAKLSPKICHTEKSFSMTAMVILVIPLIFFNNEDRYLILLAQNNPTLFLGLSVLKYFVRGKPKMSMFCANI